MGIKLENMIGDKCVKLSEYIKYLENIYTEKGDLDLYSWNGKVTNLEDFTEVDDSIILVDLKGIDTED